MADLTTPAPNTNLAIDYDDVQAIVEQVMNETSTGQTDISNAELMSGARDSLGGCFNATLFENYIRGVVRNATTLTRAQQREIEGDPLIYIIAVLIFYSCGIVVLMINYMKKEQHEFEEAAMYKQYVDKREDFSNEATHRGRSLNRLALQALNAVNVISQDSENNSRIAFV